MKTLAKSLLAIALLSFCACNGNNQAANSTDTLNTAVPERFPQPTDTPASRDSAGSDSVVRQTDTARIK